MAKNVKPELKVPSPELDIIYKILGEKQITVESLPDKAKRKIDAMVAIYNGEYLIVTKNQKAGKPFTRTAVTTTKLADLQEDIIEIIADVEISKEGQGEEAEKKRLADEAAEAKRLADEAAEQQRLADEAEANRIAKEKTEQPPKKAGVGSSGSFFNHF